MGLNEVIKYCFSVLIALLIMSVNLSADFQSVGFAKDLPVNEDMAKAFEYFKEGKALFEKSAKSKDDRLLKKSEMLLLKARSIVNEDTESLKFIVVETRLMPGSGRWPEYQDVSIDYDEPYFPNRLIAEVRSHIPPAPVMMFEFVKINERVYPLIKVENKGQSALENFVVEFHAANEKPRVLKVQKIDAGEIQTHRLGEFRGSGENKWKILFREKYGFIPCPMTF